jgi:hypothetical protein
MYKPPNEVIPKLTPNELFERRIQRDKSRLHTYNQILEQIHTRIYSAAQLDNHPAYVMYTVPPFILGLPKIDLQDCIVYVVYQLRQSGFQVRYTYPNLLYISWQHHEKEYLLHQNPIIQAMLPDKKGKKGVGFALPSPLEQQVATAPRKLASEYKPSQQFVQTMERPQADKKNSVLQDLWMFS